MRARISAPMAAGVCAAATLLAGIGGVMAQAPGAGTVAGLFTALDGNKDGAVTRDEMKTSADAWFAKWDTEKAGSLSQQQLAVGLSNVLPAAPAQQGPECGGRSSNPRTTCPEDEKAMMGALPAKAPAKPKQPRKVLVLAHAAGFVHSSIPLATRTVEEMGKKTGAWTATTTWDPADINEQNLKQYDAVFLASTTGHFLDDPKDDQATAARKKALLDFVRGGKGLVGIHAASDSYHQSAPSADGGGRARGGGRGAMGRGGRGGRGGGFGPGFGAAIPIASRMLADGDANKDQRLTQQELGAVVSAWFDKMDSSKSGRLSQADFTSRFASLWPAPPQATPGCTGRSNGQGPATQLGPDNQVGTWPEFNQMIGGFFKFHWNDGQEITYKIEEPDHPLNAPFKKVKGDFVVHDETYTFGREVYSRKNLRILTSINYDKMCDEDKKKEQYPRADHDYALSWVNSEGKGRVFYMAHGHNEKIYANPILMEHLLYGMQYALGDLPADDSPSQKGS